MSLTEFFISMFVFNTAAFWVFIGIVCSAIALDLRGRHIAFGSVVMVVTIIVMYAVKPTPWFSSIHGWIGFGLACVLYIVLGVVWSVVRLSLLVEEVKEKYRGYREDNHFVHETAIKYVEEWCRERGLGYPLTVSKCKGFIVSRIVYWPTSAGWFVIHDPVTRIAQTIVAKMSKTYQTILDHSKIEEPK